MLDECRCRQYDVGVLNRVGSNLLVDHCKQVLAAEAFAVMVEAEYADGFGLRWAWAWSVVANAASFGLGLLSRSVLGLP